jgi:PHS family inorganic phosphate transporter-like MFS transporter
LDGVLGLFSGIMALAAIVTLLIPETKGRTLEEIEGDVLYSKSVVSGGDSTADSVTQIDVNAKGAPAV